MASTNADAVARALQELREKKASIASEERELIANLNEALKDMGYQIVPATDGRGVGRGAAAKAAAGDGIARGGRQRGRRKMTAAERAAVSRGMKAYWVKRRRTKGKAAQPKNK